MVDAKGAGHRPAAGPRGSAGSPLTVPPDALKGPPLQVAPLWCRCKETGALSNAVTSRRRGVVRLTYRDRRSPKQEARSHFRHCITPFARRFGSKDPERLIARRDGVEG